MTTYKIFAPLDLEGVQTRLQECYRLESSPPRRVERRFYDSFDWRLFGAGMVMEEERAGRARRLALRELDTGHPIRVAQVGEAPRFAWDLDEQDPMRPELAPVLEMRALLPVVRLLSHSRILRLLDDEDKTVLRVVLEDAIARSTDGKREAEHGGWLRLMPVRGYPGPFEKVSRFVESELGLPRVADDFMVSAAQALGRVPGAYSSKLSYTLDPRQRSDAAMKGIHLGLLDTLEENIPGTLADLDSEFLHDLRVAVRRTRSALSQVKGVFEPQTVEYFKEGFAWVQQITGPTRDMDVYLLAFDDYKQSLPAPVREDLEPLREFLHRHHAMEQKRLARGLRSARFRGLINEWRANLEEPVPVRPSAPNGATPIVEAADARIWKMYRRVRKEGRAIGPESPPEALHELRKSCKKLRYLIEFFRSLFPDEQTGQLIKILKQLLDNLGAFQDYQVQAETLQGFAELMVAEGKTSTRTLLAMGILVGDLLERQQQAREAFDQRFARFDDPVNRQLFHQLFAPDANGRYAQ
jgi:CHAD domain-containing protein